MNWGDISFKPFEWFGMSGGKQATMEPREEIALPRPQAAPLESAESLANRRIRVIDPALGEASFKYLIHNLPESRRAVIEQSVNEITDEHIDKLTKAVNKLEYSSMDDEKLFPWKHSYPFAALAAVKKGKMSEAEFATVMFYWSLKASRNDARILVLPLFNEDGIANPPVKDAILQTCHVPKKSRAHLEGRERGAYASPEQLNEFFEKAKHLPPSQQFIFVTEDHLTDHDKELREPTGKPYFDTKEKIIRQVRYEGSLNFLDQFTPKAGQDGYMAAPPFDLFPKDADLEMLGSFGVYQTMGQVLFGENCVAIRPVIAVSTLDEIQEDGETDQRDQGLPFPGVSLPKRADEFRCETPEEFLRHDLYHFFLTGEMPSKHRKAMTYVIATEIKEILKDTTLPQDCRDYLEEYYQRVIDMEFPNYRHDLITSKDPNVNFIMGLNTLFGSTSARIFQQKGMHAGINPNAPASEFSAQIKIYISFAQNKILQRLGERIYARKDEFEQVYGIKLLDEDTLRRAHEETVDLFRTQVPARFHSTFDFFKPLTKWLVGYSTKYFLFLEYSWN